MAMNRPQSVRLPEDIQERVRGLKRPGRSMHFVLNEAIRLGLPEVEQRFAEVDRPRLAASRRRRLSDGDQR